MNIKFKKKLNGYSILEVIISLAIMGFAMTVMISFLLLSLQISSASLGRSFVRSEISNITSLIVRDLRNSNNISECYLTVCTFKNDKGEEISWLFNLNNKQIIKSVKIFNQFTNAFEDKIIFTSSPTIIFNSLNFDNGYSSDFQGANIIITISASHKNQTFKINNVLNQTSVSTRNLDIVK